MFLCISSYSKTLISRRIIYALFSQPVVGFWGRSAQGAQTPTVAPSPGASPGKSVWGHSKQVEGHTGSRRRRRRRGRGNGNGEGYPPRRTPLGIRITGPRCRLVPRLLICPPLEKNPTGAHASHPDKNNGKILTLSTCLCPMIPVSVLYYLTKMFIY